MSKLLEADVSTEAGAKTVLSRFQLYALINLILIGGFLYLGMTGNWFADQSVTTTADKFAYVFQNFAFIGLVLWISVFWVSNVRQVPNEERWQEAHRPSPGSALDLAQRITLNTLEQAVIIVLAQLALASVLTPETINATRLLAIVWVLGRLLFTVGYRIHPFHRSFGMSMTLLPPVITFGYAIYQILFA